MNQIRFKNYSEFETAVQTEPRGIVTMEAYKNLYKLDGAEKFRTKLKHSLILAGAPIEDASKLTNWIVDYIEKELLSQADTSKAA